MASDRYLLLFSASGPLSIALVSSIREWPPRGSSVRRVVLEPDESSSRVRSTASPSSPACCVLKLFLLIKEAFRSLITSSSLSPYAPDNASFSSVENVPTLALVSLPLWCCRFCRLFLQLKQTYAEFALCRAMAFRDASIVKRASSQRRDWKSSRCEAKKSHEVDASCRPGLESSDLTPEERRMFDIHLRFITCNPRQPDILVVVIDAALYHGVALAD